MLNFCDFIQVYVFTTNHHLKDLFSLPVLVKSSVLICSAEKMSFCTTKQKCFNYFWQNIAMLLHDSI